MPPPPPPQFSPPRTFTSLVQAFTSFLTVSIHTILYHRSLYPRPSFLTSRAYNTPVHQSRHPAVCTWIADAIAAVTDELLKNTVSRIVLVIYGPATPPPPPSNQAPAPTNTTTSSSSPSRLRALERYVWDVSRFPTMPNSKRDRDTPFSAAEGAEDENVDLEEQFRAALLKLDARGSALAPLPPGCTFTVAVELKDEHGVDAPLGHPQPWIPADPALQATKSKEASSGGESNEEGAERRGADLGGARTTPVRAVRAGEMMFEMWIEEGRAKVEMEEGLAHASNEGSAEFG
ncbi:DNA-binding HORMA [Macrophomina phaseolina MS6]|uniref:DNA-binding HORMA n=1 Tax=Macrophomina phaseolina (strain MS6) TaxID=1126212 RepID=K2RXP7_MACPH|nr:DNA-binding HORMA [Macrophomina phaseolina MS6]